MKTIFLPKMTITQINLSTISLLIVALLSISLQQKIVGEHTHSKLEAKPRTDKNKNPTDLGFPLSAA